MSTNTAPPPEVLKIKEMLVRLGDAHERIGRCRAAGRRMRIAGEIRRYQTELFQAVKTIDDRRRAFTLAEIHAIKNRIEEAVPGVKVLSIAEVERIIGIIEGAHQ